MTATAAPALPTLPTVTRRLNDWFLSAPDDVRAAGIDWYPAANRFAAELVELHNGAYSIEAVASVIAAVSPMLAWGRNKTIAAAYLAAHAAGIPRAEWPGIMVGRNMIIAERIMDGDLDALTGPKVTAFRDNILGNDAAITIDRWHMLAALRSNHVPNKRERALVETATRNGAASCDVTPAAYQAVIWETIRLAHGGRLTAATAASVVPPRRSRVAVGA